MLNHMKGGRQVKRRNWSPEEKMAIVLAGLKGEITLAEICRRHGIHQAQYYKWRDKFLASGKEGLSNNGKNSNVKALEDRLRQYERIIGKQKIELEILKKTLE